jgi:hypothetical protein
MGGIVAIYALVWSLSNGEYSFEGSARFPNIEECEKAKEQFASHAFLKRDFTGTIKCELLTPPSKEVTQKPKKWKLI